MWVDVVLQAAGGLFIGSLLGLIVLIALGGGRDNTP